MRRPPLELVALLGAACIGDVELPPAPPTLLPVQSPTRLATQRLSGTKPAGSAVLDRGAVIVPADDAETWAYELALTLGDNALSLTTRATSGLESTRAVTASIVYESAFPATPTVRALPARTRVTPLMLEGGKSAGTGVELDGATIAAVDAATEWSHALPLTDGTNTHTLVAVDAQGNRSEPLDLVVVLDRAPPTLRVTSPAPGEVDVPINARISLAFDGPLAVDPSAIDPQLATVTAGGQPVSGTWNYQEQSASLVFTPSALDPRAAVMVAVDPARVVDRAGNTAQPGGWSWSFTTGDRREEDAPAPPSLVGLPPTTTATTVLLSGTKPARTAVTLRNQEIVALDDEVTWRFPLALGVGANALTLRTVSRTGVVSATALSSTITRELVRPPPPALDPAPPASTDRARLELSGTRAPQTSIVVNGTVLVPRSADTRWATVAELVPGPNQLELVARDAAGVQSDPVIVAVDFTQGYSGTVPADFVLTISYSLRDLSGVDPIRSTFETGPNNYGVDMWVEGPLAPNETCRLGGGERRDIKYLATIEHYQGTKANHENPFSEPDYAGTDYLAALIEGGALRSRGLSPGVSRRGANGRISGNITQLLTVEAVAAIDTTCTAASTLNIDGCTRATVRAGPRVVQWIPLDPASRRIPQGDYLVNVLVNLDRDPGWVGANDVETCWGSAADARRGAHRFVRKVGLGSTPFTQVFAASAEAAAPDQEVGVEQLHYLADGITLSWGPAQ